MSLFSQFRLIETHLTSVRLFASDLFHELFISNLHPLASQHFTSENDLNNNYNGHNSSFNTSNVLHKLTHIFDNLHQLHRKHL